MRPLLLSLCLAFGCAGSALDDESRDLFVAAHNEVRANVSPPADPPLEPLAFDASLASTAQAWSQGCRFEHSTNGLGENLALFLGIDAAPDDVVDLWATEDAFYDYDSNRCADGEQCGHYTQIVWRSTRRVGCGVSSCNFDGDNGQLWVCNYDPPGNVVGERPY